MKGWNLTEIPESEREMVAARLEEPFYQSLLQDLQDDEIDYPLSFVKNIIRWKAEPWLEAICNYDMEKVMEGKLNLCVIDLNMLSVASQIGGPQVEKARRALYKRMGTSLGAYSEYFS